MMKIAHVAYRYCPRVGGAEAYLDQLRSAIAPIAGRQIVYQSDPGIAIDEPDVIAIKPRKLTPFKLLNFNLALWSRRGDLSAHDLVVVHNPEHLTPLLGTRRTVLVSHGATWTHEALPARRRIRKRAMERAFRSAGAVVANDSFVLREMGIDVEPGARFREEVAPGIWFVPNAVDTTAYAPDAEGREGRERPPTILVPRNLTRARGIDLAIEAFARSSRLPKDARLVVTGGAIRDMPSSRAYEEEVRAIAKSLGIAERVAFLGGVDRSAMRHLYRAASLVLVPTRFSEGTSLAAIESMASGTATITTAVEGLLDLPGPHCAASVDALREAIDTVWEGREETGRTQRAAAAMDFDLTKWSASWRSIVTTIVDRLR